MGGALAFGAFAWDGRFKCSHSLAPTSSGPGIADLPAVAVNPISLAYSGVMLATAPVPRVAMCQMPRNAASSTIDTIAARKRSEKVIWYALSTSRPGERRDPYVDGPLLARGGMRFLIEAIAAICPVC